MSGKVYYAGYKAVVISWWKKAYTMKSHTYIMAPYHSPEVSDDDVAEQSGHPLYYLGDQEISIYKEDITGLSNDQIVTLLHDPPRASIATRAPVKCQENRVFVLDTQNPSMRHADDWKADDLGVFKNAGTHPVGYYSLEGRKQSFNRRTSQPGGINLVHTFSAGPSS